MKQGAAICARGTTLHTGDVTNDGQEGYTWDAEGHVASTSGSYPDTFEYDGDGWKVYQSSGTLY
jgi:hypothetical protein